MKVSTAEDFCPARRYEESKVVQTIPQSHIQARKRGIRFFWIFWDYLDDLFKWSCRAMSRESTKAESKTKGFIFDTWSPSLWRSKSRGVYNVNLILWKLSLDPAKKCANALVVDRCDNELKHKNLVNILRMFCSLTVICSKSVSSPSLAEALIRLCWNESSNIISYMMTVFFSCWALCERNESSSTDVKHVTKEHLWCWYLYYFAMIGIFGFLTEV